MNTKSILSINIAALLIVSVTSISFAQQSGFLEKEIGNVYHVSIPGYMTKTYNLNDAASLQYLNAAKETYVIVIEDSKEELLDAGSPFKNPEDFYDHFERSFVDKSSEISALKTLKINGKPAVQVEITKSFGDYSVSYLVTVIESDTHFYKMLAWTILDYRDMYMVDFKKIANSFRDDS